MSINIRLFASLREKIGLSSLLLKSEDAALKDLSIAQLRQQLAERGPQWTILLEPDVHAAINQQMVDDSALVSKDDEVAFFPPVTGG